MDAAAHVTAFVRSHDPDRYRAALFAPAAARDGLVALAGFDLEIARIREVVREPMPGEIRLQWWRDALEVPDAETTGHPVVDLLRAAIARHRLPIAPMIALIDARTFDLYDDPMPDLTAFEGYAGETAGAIVQLGAIVLTGEGTRTGAAAGHAGVALTIVQTLANLPRTLARGQMMLPADVLARHGAEPASLLAGEDTPQGRAALAEMRDHARHHLGRVAKLMPDLPPEALPAFLPVATVPRLLKRLETVPGNPLRTLVDVSPLARLWSLWRLARSGRLPRV